MKATTTLIAVLSAMLVTTPAPVADPHRLREENRKVNSDAADAAVDAEAARLHARAIRQADSTGDEAAAYDRLRVELARLDRYLDERGIR